MHIAKLSPVSGRQLVYSQSWFDRWIRGLMANGILTHR